MVKVLDPTRDEDGDGYTNETEINEGTNPEDSTSRPNDITAPTITITLDPTASTS
jgi:hypothetical protein